MAQILHINDAYIIDVFKTNDVSVDVAMEIKKLLEYMDCTYTAFLYLLLKMNISDTINPNMVSISNVFKSPIRVDTLGYTNTGMSFMINLDKHIYLEDVLDHPEVVNIIKPICRDRVSAIPLARALTELLETILRSIDTLSDDRTGNSIADGYMFLYRRNLYMVVEDRLHEGCLYDYY